MNRSRTPSPLPTMKTKLHTLLLVATAFGTHAVAQDTPPPSPPQGLPPGAPGEPPRRPDSPPRPDGDRPRPEAGRRPDGDRPRMEERRRPEGDRAPGSEPRRNPGEDSRREGEPRGEGGPSWFSPPPAAQRLRPYLGVVTSPAPAAVAAQAGLAEGFGLVVDEVLPDSPAKAAGLERYDVLARFEDQKLVDSAQLAALVGAASKDASISLTLIRKGQEQKLSVKVGEKMLPDRPAGAAPQFPQIRELWNRYGDAARRSIEPGGEFAERAQEAGRKAQEISREFQRRMQEFQEKVEQWRKNPNEKFPETPKFPNLSPQPQPGLPGEMLREVRPGRARGPALGTRRHHDVEHRQRARLDQGRSRRHRSPLRKRSAPRHRQGQEWRGDLQRADRHGRATPAIARRPPPQARPHRSADARRASRTTAGCDGATASGRRRPVGRMPRGSRGLVTASRDGGLSA